MRHVARVTVVVALAAAVGTALIAREHARSEGPHVTGRGEARLPRLVELDAVDCAPCQAMVSVLASLRRDCAGSMRVERIDVRQHRDIEAAYRVRFSPTQVFEDPSGRELWRHEGFLSRADILAKWRDLGYKVDVVPSWAGGVGWVARLFAALARALESTVVVALGGAYLWGLLSVLLSPCHMANIALVIGFIDGQGRISARRAFGLSAVFAAGVLTMIGAIGGLTVAAGRLAGDVGAVPNYFVALVLFAVGLHMLDVVPMPWPGRGLPALRRRGPLAALALGLLFGVALGPCTFAYMAPMLGVAFKVAGARPAYGALLLLAYGLGHCSVIVAAGTSTELVQRWMDWDEAARGRELLRRICGALILAGGVYLIYAA
jgi:cytochrome c-type biogenesis protein